MNLIQIATGAAVISTPLYVLAFAGSSNLAMFEETPATFLYPHGQWLTAAAFADFDDDGFADAAATGTGYDENSSPFTLQIYRGIGNGQFTLVQQIDLEDIYPGWNSGWSQLKTADVNGDGHIDIIVQAEVIDAIYTHPWITFLNTGGTGFRCAGDVDGDGQTRVEDLVGLLEDWGCDDNAQ